MKGNRFGFVRTPGAWVLWNNANRRAGRAANGEPAVIYRRDTRGPCGKCGARTRLSPGLCRKCQGAES